MCTVIFSETPTRNLLTVLEQANPFANRFMLVLTIAVLLLIGWMLIFHAMTASRYREMDRFKALITKNAEKAVNYPNLMAENILPPVNNLFGKAHISALNELLTTLEPESKNALKVLLSQLDCTSFISKGLDNKDNEEYLIDLMRIVGELGLKSLSDKITGLIKANRHNIDIIFEALLALARMNSSSQFLQICMDKKYTKNISFRNLQEIVIAFTGNRETLYKKLLTAPDNYIIRICIKRIGAEEITALVPKIVQFLDSKNTNLIIDTLRTIGALKYSPAANKVKRLLKHEHWEVRNAVVQAIASIDVNKNIDPLVEALQDKEWFVRYNAGVALCSAKDFITVRSKVGATNDKFAIEMLEYISTMNELKGVV